MKSTVLPTWGTQKEREELHELYRKRFDEADAENFDDAKSWLAFIEILLTETQASDSSFKITRMYLSDSEKSDLTIDRRL